MKRLERSSFEIGALVKIKPKACIKEIAKAVVKDFEKDWDIKNLTFKKFEKVMEEIGTVNNKNMDIWEVTSNKYAYYRKAIAEVIGIKDSKIIIKFGNGSIIEALENDLILFKKAK